MFGLPNTHRQVKLAAMSETGGKSVVVFGSSRPKPGSRNYQQAYELGQLLGRAGLIVANGGYGGIMAATAEGARRYHTTVIGVTCEAFGRGPANSWVTREIRTQNIYERLQTLLELGDAFVVLPGGTGTLLELSAVWELVNKGFLSCQPIICLGDFWKPVIQTLVQSGECANDIISFRPTAEAVVRTLIKQLAETR